MRLRVLLGFVGLGMGSFGLFRFLHHDLIAPITLVATVLGRHLVPRRAWVAATRGVIVLLTVTATAIPVLGSWGSRSDNATLLDRDYIMGWCVFAALVLLASLLPLRRGRMIFQNPKDREAG